MYKAFYSLATKPFGKDISTKDIYQSTCAAEAAARLAYLQRTRGIGLLTGDPGAGKTLAIRTFCEALNPGLYKSMYLPLSTLTVTEFYAAICYALGETPKFRKIDNFKLIQQTILTLYKSRGITPVIVMDEMQLARDAFYQDLSILFNFGMDSETPFILLLVGLPLLSSRLNAAQHRAFNQRILMRYSFDPLSETELAAYIAHQMRVAGANHTVFTEPAVKAIHALTRGWPRSANSLCNSALLAGYSLKKDVIDEEIVRIAAEDAGI